MVFHLGLDLEERRIKMLTLGNYVIIVIFVIGTITVMAYVAKIIKWVVKQFEQ